LDADATAQEFAWKVHSALADWTGRVDTKASIALSLEAAVLVLIISQSAETKPLAGLTDFALLLYWVGFAALLLAIVFSLLVVVPQLKRRKLAAEAPDGLIYFGHLRLRTPDDVEASLRDPALRLPALSRQLVAMAKIAWRKHVFLQASLLLAAVSAMAFLGAVASA